MKKSISKIKKLTKENGDVILVGAIAGAACFAGIATHKWLMQRGAIVVPKVMVDYMKNSDESILGVNMIKGYDIAVGLIPVKQ